MRKEHTNAVNRHIISQPKNVKLYQNFTGTVYASSETYKTGGGLLLKNPRVIKAGCFGPGGEDLLGYTIVEITADMVGKELPIFTTCEIKTPNDRIRPDQKRWLNIHKKDGCIVSVVRYDGYSFEEIDF